MTDTVQERIRSFATMLLERRGALVEWAAADEAGTVLLTPDVAERAGVAADVVPIATEVHGGGLSVNLAGEFLEWTGRLLEAEPRVGVYRVRSLYLKRKELEQGISRAFTWLNAKVKFRESREVSLEYHTWWFHGSLASEDRWETSFCVSLNVASGVEVELPDPLKLYELEPQPEVTATPTTYERALLLARRRLLTLAAGFTERMDSRRQRDRKRLSDYYGALSREVQKKPVRGHTPPDPEKIESAKRAVTLELRRKLAELDDRYRMEARLLPVVLVRVELPVVAVDLSVFRKQAVRVHTVYWNPLLKQFEPLPCGCCGGGASAVAFTNDDVQPRCAACGIQGRI